MNFITTALNKLFKSSNQQELNKIKPIKYPNTPPKTVDIVHIKA